jgi:hypothetical protein
MLKELTELVKLALVPHAKLMKSTEALWTKVLPKFA